MAGAVGQTATMAVTDRAIETWGRHIEDELTWVEAVVTYAVTHGQIDSPTAWVRSRHAPLSVYTTRAAVDEFIDRSWFPEHVFFLRQVPSLRFDTVHGSVVVTDVWGDTGYRTLLGRHGRDVLRLNTPLLRVAQRVLALSTATRKATEPRIETARVGWQITEPLRPRMRLQAWSSVATWPDDSETYGPKCGWVPEEYRVDRAGANRVVKAFLEVNEDADLAAAETRMSRLRKKVADDDGLDVGHGIALLEDLANRLR